MKKTVIVSLFMAFIMLLLHLTAIGKEIVAEELKPSAAQTEILKIEEKLQFRVFDKETEKIILMDTDEYIFGVVAAEMPALYHEEALKAQAVAAYTFAYTRSLANKNKDYDITNDYTVDQSYISRENARKKWGSKAKEYEEKIDACVKATSGLIITYNGNPITAVYHAISSGKTESSKDIWGSNLKYLTSVSSDWDKNADSYSVTVSFTPEEIKEKIKGITFSGKKENYFGKCTRTAAGSVKEITVCKKNISGSEIRKALNLRSTNFSVKYKDGKFEFTVIGYGHGVGMSQYGANALAKERKTCEEILKWYYTGVEIG